MNQSITINIDVKEGYELKYNPETRTVEEVKKEPIRSKSWEEFCNNHRRIDIEYYIASCGNIDYINNVNRECPNNLATREDAEGILALIQLTRLHDEWVDGWVPNWTTIEPKFIIDYYKDTLGVDLTYSSKRFLTFPTKKIAKEFLDCFGDLIKKAKKFI